MGLLFLFCPSDEGVEGLMNSQEYIKEFDFDINDENK